MFRNLAVAGPLFVIAIVIILIAVLAFEIAMFISVIKNKYISSNARILWIIGMFLIHPIVALVYYFTDHKRTN